MIPYLSLIMDVLAIFAVYMIITVSLNLEVGYAGIPQFGKVLVVAAGALVAGALPGRLMALMMGLPVGGEYVTNNARIMTLISRNLQTNPALSIGLLLLTLVVAAAAGAAMGIIASRPAIRLREAYLGITLLAMGDTLVVIGHNYPPLVGGPLGVAVPDPMAWVGREFRFPAMSIVMLMVAVAVLIFAERLVRSPFGRTSRAMRDCELATKVMGKDIVRLRTSVITVSSALGALGGALFAFYSGMVVAAGYDKAGWTFWPWAYMILGGTANNIGVTAGVLIFLIVRRLIILYKGALAFIIPFDPVWLEPLLLGLSLMLIVMFKPGGIIPEKPTHTLSPERIREIMTAESEEPAEETRKESKPSPS